MKERAKRKAISAGHICLDITPAISQNKSYQNIGEYLIPGRLIPVGKPDIHTGGSVGNTGLAMKVLGADVKLMGKVGTDDFGKLVLSQLKEYGVESGMIVAEGDETSYSVVISVAGIDRIILHDSGANNTFTMEDIDFDLVRDASLFHFAIPPSCAACIRTGERRWWSCSGRSNLWEWQPPWIWPLSMRTAKPVRWIGKV